MAIKINKIKSTNMELTDAISDFVMARVNSLDKFVNPDDTSASIDIEVGKTTEHHNKGNVFMAEFNLQVGGKNFRSSNNNEDLYTAIDKVKEEMANELRRNKGKNKTLFKKGSSVLKNLLKGFNKN
jgi:ribosomal subunit interface protein